MKKISTIVHAAVLLASAVALSSCGTVPTPENEAATPLASWSDGPAKASILDFVARVTDPDHPDFVPGPERIAVFDNDGTLWAEQPAYFQLLFAMERSGMSMDSLATLDKEKLLALIGETHGGMTTAEFQATVSEWIRTARHPRFNRPYTEMVYRPQLELLEFLRSSGFKTFIVSGGGIEFMRVFAEEVYGIPPEQVIGSTIVTKFEMRNGKPVLVREPELDFIDDEEGKPIAINKFIGRRPILAFGNSDGDLQMLQWTAAGDGASLMLYVHHDDAEREWAYDRKSHIGRLDKGLDEANQRGWTVVSMKNDWLRVF